MAIESNASPFHSISYGEHKIIFSLSFHHRKTLGIEVHPDQSVSVKSPLGKELEEIEKVVKKRASWILKQQRHFAQFPQEISQKKYISGESFRYLGKQYRLKVIDSDLNQVSSTQDQVKLIQDQVKLIQGRFRVEVKDLEDKVRIEKLLKAWYRKRSKPKFLQYLKEVAQKLAVYGIPCPPLEIKDMKTRWGSCTPDGLVLLNPDLIKAPPSCIEYVIYHELCHLKYHHHGVQFYDFLSLVLPDWKERKKNLDLLACEILTPESILPQNQP